MLTNGTVQVKTFTYELIFHAVRALGVRCITMASTGCAATLLPGGRTVHNVWAIPVPTYSDSESRVDALRAPLELKEAKVFILDEAPMLLKHILEAIDRRLREIHMKPDVPFGGVVMLLGKLLRFRKWHIDNCRRRLCAMSSRLAWCVSFTVDRRFDSQELSVAVIRSQDVYANREHACTTRPGIRRSVALNWQRRRFSGQCRRGGHDRNAITRQLGRRSVQKGSTG